MLLNKLSLCRKGEISFWILLFVETNQDDAFVTVGWSYNAREGQLYTVLEIFYSDFISLTKPILIFFVVYNFR